MAECTNCLVSSEVRGGGRDSLKSNITYESENKYVQKMINAVHTLYTQYTGISEVCLYPSTHLC